MPLATWKMAVYGKCVCFNGFDFRVLWAGLLEAINE